MAPLTCPPGAPGKGQLEGRSEAECKWVLQSLPRGPHLGQGLDAHQIHKADPAQVEDEGVEGDEGRDTGQ